MYVPAMYCFVFAGLPTVKNDYKVRELATFHWFVTHYKRIIDMIH